MFEVSPSRENTNAEKYTLRKTLFGTEDVLPAWVADMDLPTPSFVLEAIQKRLSHPIMGYEEFPDLAKQAQIEWIKRHHHITLEKELILYSHSIVASMSVFIQAFSKKEDEIIVQTPVYPPFFHQVTQNGRKVLKNPLKKDQNGIYRFDLEDLKSKITPKTKLLLLCNPHNPVGRAWTKEELQELLDICKKNDILIFSDEIHSDLVFAPHKHTPLLSLQGAKKIVVSAYGVGKTFNMAGFAISTICFADQKLFKRYKEVYDAIHFAQGATLSHVAFQSAYTQGDEWLKELKAHLWHNYTKLLKALKPYNHLIQITPLEATYLAWLDCRKMQLGDRKLRKWFIEEVKLGLNPGIAFGREGSGYMRLNFAVSSQMMDEIIKRLTKGLTCYET